MSDIRVRISPSDTGKSIHIGNLKCALYNYLFAAKNGGTFYLRIEDTDLDRKVEGAAENILNDLKWAGIAPTEGFLLDQKYPPYVQSQRQDVYENYANHLLEKGFLYKCYCTEEELNAQREAALKINPKSPFKYPGTCRTAKDQDKPHSLRLKAPTDGHTSFSDIIFGDLSFSNKENYDFVIKRSNGGYLYSFCCVVDDIEHRTSHIIRGSDHLKNMPQQLAIYKALDATIPKMAHLGMILNQKGEKLSKRDGSVLVSEYRDNGFAPSAILNYLARLGWGCGNQEIFSLEELVDKFSLEACGKNDGKFDPKKFSATQTEHIKHERYVSDANYVKFVRPFVGDDVSEQLILALLPMVRPRAKTFIEAANEIKPIAKKQTPTQEVIEKFLSPENKERIKSLTGQLGDVKTWDENTVKQAVNIWLEKNNLTIKDIGQSLRVSLVGRTNSPDLFQVMNVIGREETITRLAE